ncbi:ATPase, P-type (transporting), HAD superfamily, subfamily IC/heavy metal translocating P-type ATPase [Actinoalloteichus cyanogriseus DSM 43889]|uniref:ATPase, P-type (Transporting), HAD superfamily, subfamily IC/heavy metal translocating P-type ATPase n=1 Tax=Actinoalloteichus caeruleus DSM 43889 TaxID=1120930 RepID=A0ABT1JB88_ACTCY|nr:ATPase, P-type (transporting), HAD superfamily, subfamily IC/heavy metal translocating P-type ATPase [Actinoalloteichus caeruleus DSM 43889]
MVNWRFAFASSEAALLVTTTTLLAAGGLVWIAHPGAARVLWAVATVVGLVPATVWVIGQFRAGRWGADLLAVLALASTLVVGEFLAGAVVAVMVGTGRLLETLAQRRAGHDLSALLDRIPRTAKLVTVDGPRPVPVAELGPGDRIVVAPGEVVPVDAGVTADAAFDESALTGEPDPVTRRAGDTVRSGVVSVGEAVELVATASAEDSTYAGVVRLAEQAGAGAAPVARLADRVAAWFLPTALAIAGLSWLTSGDAVRAVAVLVVATPCPLLLAVPIAVTGGLSLAARSGVVVKGGATLELLGRAATLATDKTGTVTVGRPEVVGVVCAPGEDAARVLALAAAVESYSTHVLAGAVVRAAAGAGLRPPSATEVRERHGVGVEGRVEGSAVRVGRAGDEGALPDWARGAASRGRLDLATPVWVTVDDRLRGALLMRDRVRTDAGRTIRRLRAVGLRDIVLVTGDRVANAEEVAALLGLDAVRAEASPADKIRCVRDQRRRGITVMVGDGVNDAPALAAADVGVALGSRGSTAAAQAADAVILDDRIDRLADVVEIARRTRGIAVRSAVVGTSLSVVAMIVAAVGWLPPVAGAVAQEGIDVVVILYALRALRRPRRTKVGDPTDRMLRRFAAEHDELQPTRVAVRQAADALSGGPSPVADAELHRAHRLLVDHLLPHERAEERDLYPRVGALFGGQEAMSTMSRSHVEIERLIRRLGRHLAESGGRVLPDQVDDLRATLYGLDAVLTLHFAQEEEAFFTLADPDPEPRDVDRRRGLGGAEEA